MKNTIQFDGQNMIQHGLMVWKYVSKILSDDMTDIRVPKWLLEYKDDIMHDILDRQIIKRASILHDMGKPLVKIISDDGTAHYPNHAEKSYEVFSHIFPSHNIEASLIKYDMVFHSCSYDEIISLGLDKDELLSLMIIALGAIHANAYSMGDGIESTSFKIKFKKLEKLGNKLCNKFFNHAYMYVIVRTDLSKAQQAVQATHAAIESSRKYLKGTDEHPSVILCSIKNENKLMSYSQKFKDQGIDHIIFREPDRNNEITALASKPLIGKQREPFKKFQLLT